MKRSLIVLLWLLSLLLVACGGSASGPSTTTANLSSSTETASPTFPSLTNAIPTVLHVTRTDPSATNNIGPLDKTITEAATVQNLYNTALKQSAYPTGASISQSCLNDTGVIYHLDFLQGTIEVQRVNLDPGDCKVLYLSQSDLRQASDSFLHLLQQALQISSLTAK